MQTAFSYQLPRLLGKYEFIVYYLLFCAEQERIAPVSRKWIIEHMPGPISPNTVTAALTALCAPEQRLAVRLNDGWRLMTEGIQLFLGTEGVPMRSESAQLSISRGPSPNKEDVSTITPPLLLTDETRAESAAVFRLMVSLGVFPKKAKQLAKLPWVTQEYVKAHMELAESEGWEKPVGMAIYRIESEAPMPDESTYESAEERERKKYIRGKFSDQIKH
jgi:hypothetical protein